MTEHTHTHEIDSYFERAQNISLSIVGGNDVLIAILGLAILLAICFFGSRRCSCRNRRNPIGIRPLEEQYLYGKGSIHDIGERSRRPRNY